MPVCAISKEDAKEWRGLCGVVTVVGGFIAFVAGLTIAMGNNPPGSWDATVSGCVIFVVGLVGVIVSTIIAGN